MKYCVLIIDGAAGRPMLGRDGQTCFELADTPNLDAMVQNGILGLVRTVPAGMEPDSSVACMSVLGYNPMVYYGGRAPIEATSMGIDIEPGDVVFRCNLVSIRDGRMLSHSSGYISTEEAHALMATLNEKLGSDKICFYPGVSYRNILKIKGAEETAQAICTPPHDIPGKTITDFLPRGPGSELLLELMERSEAILRECRLNLERASRGDLPATTIWLFWGSSSAPEMPPFRQVYGINASMTSAVDLLRGLARMAGMAVVDIAGITDGLDNDYTAQANGALEALKKHDMVIIHIEAPDEAAHSGSIENKVAAIEKIDEEVVGRLRSWKKDALRVLALPDHPTPIELRTHTDEPVPFLLWGPGFTGNGAIGYTEKEADKTGLFIDPGYTIMNKLLRKSGE